MCGGGSVLGAVLGGIGGMLFGGPGGAVQGAMLGYGAGSAHDQAQEQKKQAKQQQAQAEQIASQQRQAISAQTKALENSRVQERKQADSAIAGSRTMGRESGGPGDMGGTLKTGNLGVPDQMLNLGQTMLGKKMLGA